MSHAYLVGALRTPIGKYLHSLASQTAPQLGALPLRALVERCGLSVEQVNEVVMGNVVTAGIGQAPARQAALLAGLPSTVPAVTVNKVCGSGMKAVMMADQAVRAGDAQCILAGGMESMSNAPYLLPNARKGFRYGNQTAVDALIHDGLWCATEQRLMGEMADETAAKNDVTRQIQDEYAVLSHQRAIAAHAAGTFADEIVPVDIVGRRGTTQVTDDEGPREDTSIEGLAKLRPVFDPAGTVTAGNASQLSDGAAALAVVDHDLARQLDVPWRARIVGHVAVGLDPRDVFVTPVPAVRQLLAKVGWSIDDIDLFELSEAFAAQCLACLKQLELPADKVNVHGGGIALGHPIGASGARILVTLLHALVQRSQTRGVAGLCLGGGNATAIAVELEA